MCENVVLLDGTELWDGEALVEHGIVAAEQLPEWNRGRCLCGVELEPLLNPDDVWPPRFRRGGIWGGWEEVDANGLTYNKDGFVEDPAQSTAVTRFMVPNPDYPYHA